MFGYQLARVIIAHVTLQELGVFPFMFPFPLVALNAHVALVDPLLVGCGYLLLVFAVYAHFVVTVIGEICDYLGISCFTIPPEKVQAALEEQRKQREAERKAA
jgi:hypothetical protein